MKNKPKEKAIELVKSYRKLWIKSNDARQGNMSLHLLTPANLAYIPFCKQCAIIAVDELIEQNGELFLTGLCDDYYRKKNSYLFDVKQEIEKL